MLIDGHSVQEGVSSSLVSGVIGSDRRDGVVIKQPILGLKGVEIWESQTSKDVLAWEFLYAYHLRIDFPQAGSVPSGESSILIHHGVETSLYICMKIYSMCIQNAIPA